MEVSLLTAKCTLVPSRFFDPSAAKDMLGEVARLKEDDRVAYVEVPQYGSVLIYSEDDDTVKILDESVSGGYSDALPEMFFILEGLQRCNDFNKILCSWSDGLLFMAIAQGGRLLLCNVYQARDFETAEYFIFWAMKSLQLNPEVSTICWRLPLGAEEEMSLYRYFKSVEQLSGQS